VRPASAYACLHARLQARHGARPGALLWRAIDSARVADHLLEVARASCLRPWVQGFGPRSTAHEVERELRARWRAYCLGIAAYQPAADRAATRWLALLPWLPAAAALLRGAPAAPWMRADPQLAALAAADPGARPAEFAAGEFAPLVAAEASGEAARDFDAHWRRLVAAHSAAERAGVTRVASALALARVASTAALGHGEQLLERVFRRVPQTAVATSAHLLLVRRDADRLRAALLRALLFERGAAAA